VRTRDLQLEARVSDERLRDSDRLLVGPALMQRLLIVAIAAIGS
jgi:hypothetical protein